MEFFALMCGLNENGDFALKRLQALVRMHGAHMRPHMSWAQRVSMRVARGPSWSKESACDLRVVSMNIRSLKRIFMSSLF